MAEKEASKDAKPDQPDSPKNSAAIAFLNGTKEEFDKVVWPGRQQLASESIAVILMVTLSAALIYLVDRFFDWGAALIFQ